MKNNGYWHHANLAQHNGLHEPTAYTLATFLSKQSNRIGLGIFVRRNSSKRTGWATWLRATMQIPMWCLSRGARTSESYLYEAWKALTRKNQETSWLALRPWNRLSTQAHESVWKLGISNRTNSGSKCACIKWPFLDTWPCTENMQVSMSRLTLMQEIANYVFCQSSGLPLTVLF